LKIGIVSFAHMHAHSYATALRKISGIELVGIVDDEPERGRKAAEKYETTYFADLETFLAARLDAVIVCSENIFHKDFVIAAAEAGKHILCEKPIATNVEDAKEMIAVCQANQVNLQIAFPVRFNQSIMDLKARIAAGELGDIIACRTTNRGTMPTGWFLDTSLSGGGAVLDHTVHMADIMRWYFDSEVKEVYSYVDSQFHHAGIDDAGILTFEFENGIIGTHDASWSKFKQYPTWGDIYIEVIGSKKTVRVEPLQEHIRVFRKEGKAYSYAGYANDMNLALIRDFVNGIKQKRTPSITGEDGLKAMEVALAAYESSKTREPVLLK